MSRKTCSPRHFVFSLCAAIPSLSLIHQPAFADEAWMSYCYKAANTYAYAAKLRDLGKTEGQVFQMTEAPLSPSATAVVRAADNENYKALIRNVFRNPLVPPEGFYNSTLDACRASSRNK
jgi:hypothetical protein